RRRDHAGVDSERYFQSSALNELLLLELRGASLGFELADHLLQIADRLEALPRAATSQDLSAQCRRIRERAQSLKARIAATDSLRGLAEEVAAAKKAHSRARRISGLHPVDPSPESDGFTAAG